MIKKILHFGCSFAIGNGIPKKVKGLKSGAYVHATRYSRQEFKKAYDIHSVELTNCCSVLSKSLGLSYSVIAENGASNERTFRTLLKENLKKSFVLIGLTNDSRREGLTTTHDKSHWHTWKMADPRTTPYYKLLPFNPWGKEYTPAIDEENQIRTVIQILYMQSYLKLKNIPYLMYNALYNSLDAPLTVECKELLHMVDQTHFYELQGNSSTTQHGYCLEKDLVVSDRDEHPNVLGHQEWANKLLPQIKEIIDNGN